MHPAGFLRRAPVLRRQNWHWHPDARDPRRPGYLAADRPDPDCRRLVPRQGEPASVPLGRARIDLESTKDTKETKDTKKRCDEFNVDLRVFVTFVLFVC